MLTNINDSTKVKRKIGDTEFTRAQFPSLHTPASRETCSDLPGSTSVIESTLVKRALNARKWLEVVTSALPSEPSPELKKMLVVNGISMVDEVVKRANIVLTALFPTSQLAKQQIVSSLEDINLMESLWSEQRRNEALKLYYRILESICRSENENLSNNGHLGAFLTNERFHRSLFACSAELVSAALTGNGMLLSMVYERTGITAFDLSKVIETFIIHEPNLPRELKRHLNSFEEQLLEMRVWEKGSSLYNHLIIAKPSLSHEINQLDLLAKPLPSLETIAFQNPVSFRGLVSSSILKRNGISPAQDRGSVSRKKACREQGNKVLKHEANSPKPFSTPSSSSRNTFTRHVFGRLPKGSTAHGDSEFSSAAIDILFRKMAKLAAIRIRGLSERLKVAQKFRDNVYFVFQQILNHKTLLFFDRHINLIIICCFLALGKKSGMNLTLKTIFDNYMKHPGCRIPVFSSLSGNHQINGEQYSDIITFYKAIFLPSVASFLEETGNEEPPTHVAGINNNDGSSACHHTFPFPSLPDISPRKVSASHNVYLSPARLSKGDLTSYMATSLYASFGESIYPHQTPSKQLSQINHRLNRINKVKRRLNFEEKDIIITDDLFKTNIYTCS